MLAIHRLFTRCRRNHGLRISAVRLCCGEPHVGGSEDYSAELVEKQGKPFNRFLHSARFYSSTSFGKAYSYSSQSGTKSSGEEFNDLEYATAKEVTSEDETDGSALSANHELSDDDGDDASEELFADPEAFDDEFEVGGAKKLRKDFPVLSMLKAILASTALPVSAVVNKWLEEGNELTKAEVSSAMFHLRKRKLFRKALQLSEWLGSERHLDLSERYYASHIDLLAKMSGVHKAEEYLHSIPQSFRGELVFQALLAGCVSATNLKKSEEVFSRMKELHIPLSCFSCNKMLHLYSRTDSKKIPHVLRLMEEEDIRPSLFTYEVLIKWKGQANDVHGMEELVEGMKSKGLEPNSRIRASLAKNYAVSGLKDKAEEMLKAMEDDDLVKNRWACCWLLHIYAILGRDDEVERIWRVCEPSPHLSECMAAIEAWGRLRRVENAEAAFEKLLQRANRPSTRHIAFMLRVYADHKMLEKGKDLMKRMSSKNCKIGPLARDALVKLYVNAGETEKAASVVEKCIAEKSGRPFFSSIVYVMDKFAQKGDVHNAEKMFMMMKKAGYATGAKQYQILLDAYINSNTPVYGFVDRMRADNIFPSRSFAHQLARADAFRKDSVLQLL